MGGLMVLKMHLRKREFVHNQCRSWHPTTIWPGIFSIKCNLSSIFPSNGIYNRWPEPPWPRAFLTWTTTEMRERGGGGCWLILLLNVIGFSKEKKRNWNRSSIHVLKSCGCDNMKVPRLLSILLRTRSIYFEDVSTCSIRILHHLSGSHLYFHHVHYFQYFYYFSYFTISPFLQFSLFSIFHYFNIFTIFAVSPFSLVQLNPAPHHLYQNHLYFIIT